MKAIEKEKVKIPTKKIIPTKTSTRVGSYEALLEAAEFAKKVNLAKRYSS